MSEAFLVPKDEAIVPNDPDSPAARHIRDDIAAHGGAITYERFMELSMQGRASAGDAESDYGFYASGRAEVGGADGPQDFVTHADSPAFGATIAHYGYNMWLKTGAPPQINLVEMGAGNGNQAASFLAEVDYQASNGPQDGEHPFAAFKNALTYTCLEYGAGMIAKQRERLAGQDVSWVHGSAIDLPIAPVYEAADQQPPPILFVSNELPDTFPVHRVVQTGSRFVSRLKEVYVSTHNGGFYEFLGDLSSEKLKWEAKRAQYMNYMVPGAERIFNLNARRWAWNMSEVLKNRKGGILMTDYGHPRDIVDLPPRYYHRSVRAPYAGPDGARYMYELQYREVGNVDITTSVPFANLDAIIRRHNAIAADYVALEPIFLQKYGLDRIAARLGDTAAQLRLSTDMRSFMAYSYLSRYEPPAQ